MYKNLKELRKYYNLTQAEFDYFIEKIGFKDCCKKAFLWFVF